MGLGPRLYSKIVTTHKLVCRVLHHSNLPHVLLMARQSISVKIISTIAENPSRLRLCFIEYFNPVAGFGGFDLLAQYHFSFLIYIMFSGYQIKTNYN